MGGILQSDSDAMTQPKHAAAPGLRRPATYWFAHVALVIAVAAVGILWGFGPRGPLREWDVGLQMLIVFLLSAMFIIARRIGGAFGNGTPYALFAAGAVCSLAHKFVAAESLGLALTIFCALFFLSGIILIVPKIRRLRSSQ
jgi:hypothetical protein